jgi:hypothetical protein
MSLPTAVMIGVPRGDGHQHNRAGALNDLTTDEKSCYKYPHNMSACRQCIGGGKSGKQSHRGTESTMDDAYDVIVIGSGFGGPVAARLCAEAGLRTLMLERSENVGEKVISGLTIPIYGFLFGPDFIRDGNPPFERPADGIINYLIKMAVAGIPTPNSMKSIKT